MVNQVERQIPSGVASSWIRAGRMAPDRLPLSPEWEARARELRRDWTRVAAQLEALARALQPSVAGVPTDRRADPGGPTTRGQAT